MSFKSKIMTHGEFILDKRTSQITKLNEDEKLRAAQQRSEALYVSCEAPILVCILSVRQLNNFHITA
jgi:hypothetical protein